MLIRRIPQFDLKITAESGQCFRFTELDSARFSLIAGGRLLEIEALGDEQFRFACDQASFDAYWADYFDLSRDYQAILSGIPEDDGFLTAAAAFAGGLRILRQDPWETLICFIISQRKSIPAIKRCVALLCQAYGAPIGGGHHAFPSPATLSAASLEGLNACGLGYRSRYVLGTAQRVASGGIDLAALHSMDDDALMEALLTLPGVGIKVAHCVMLFGFQRMDAFPRDVWILRVLENHYPAGFPLHRFQGHAGIIQQYMFCYGRSPAYRKMQEYIGNTTDH